jgi:Mrp family chromosome partitioning ATPase
LVSPNLETVQAAEVRRYLASDPALEGPFRALADNLLSLAGPVVGSVAVTGPEAGVGRSSVCLGLGAALAALGNRVAVVDCNLNRPHLHRLFGRSNFTGLTNALDNGRSPELYGFEAAPRLCVVPTGPVLPGSAQAAESERLVVAVRALRETRDIVLLDAPVAGRLLESPVLLDGFDGVLLVVHATRTPKSVARRVTDDLLDAGINLLGVVLNGYSASRRPTLGETHDG